MMKLGSFHVRAIEAGRFRLDGGAMFGVVPKVLWQRTNPADRDNRIEMAMRVLFLEGEGRRLIVDSGAGVKLDGKKMQRIYGIAAGELGAVLRENGIDPASVTDAVVTHLHFDHAGGFTYRDETGAVRLALPEAAHYVQRRQWEWAQSPNEKDRASFIRENFVPIEDAGRLRLVDGRTELFPGVTLIPTDGHTPGHQLVLVETDEASLLYGADLVPLASHINLPYIMAYDHQPLETLEEKKRLLGRAADEGWILFFEHDPEIAACTVRRKNGDRFEMAEVIEIG